MKGNSFMELKIVSVEYLLIQSQYLLKCWKRLHRDVKTKPGWSGMQIHFFIILSNLLKIDVGL